jgi:hypothetical protein
MRRRRRRRSRGRTDFLLSSGEGRDIPERPRSLGVCLHPAGDVTVVAAGVVGRPVVGRVHADRGGGGSRRRHQGRQRAVCAEAARGRSVGGVGGVPDRGPDQRALSNQVRHVGVADRAVRRCAQRELSRVAVRDWIDERAADVAAVTGPARVEARVCVREQLHRESASASRPPVRRDVPLRRGRRRCIGRDDPGVDRPGAPEHAQPRLSLRVHRSRWACVGGGRREGRCGPLSDCCLGPALLSSPGQA